MAQSIVSPIASKLGSLLTDEVKFLCGVNDKIKILQDEFKLMQCFLEDIDARQDGDKRFLIWVAQIREIAYDVDDIIDVFKVKVESRRQEGCIGFNQMCACIFKGPCTLHQLGLNIEAVTTQISNLTRQLQTYGVKESTERESSSTLHIKSEERRSYPHIIEHNVVGLDKNIQELVQALVGDKNPFQIVLIWGMGGIGKTTLAKKIYHDKQVRHHFNRFAWAYVSQQCQTKNVWQEIALGLAPEQRNMILNLKDAELPGKLHQILQENKCLVIVDDIWRSEDWNNLKVAFPNGETTSVIVVTSRNKEIASHHNRILHKIKLLNEDDGWELLQKIAIPKTLEKDFDTDSKKEELGKKFITHCKGLPLAIRLVGGMLAIRHSLNEWEMMNKDIKSIIKKSKSNEQGNLGVNDVLALSYNSLPPYLKPCFLYLGSLPEDGLISVPQLIHMWIAEGFITSNEIKSEEETLEDVGEDYIMELIARCMVLVEEIKFGFYRIKACRLHDLMRDFCLLKTREENFLYVFDCQHGWSNFCPRGSCSKIDKAHRLALHQPVLIESVAGPHLNPRSLFLFNSNFRSIEPLKKDCEGIITLFRQVLKIQRSQKFAINKFKMLRVLDCKCLELTCVTKDMGKLIHLRYLCLLNAKICKLSSSLGNLRQLQTLDLQVMPCMPTSLYIPNILWKIKGLRNLYLPRDYHWSSKTKLHFGSLIHLQTLVNFVIPNCDVNDLLNLRNLKELQLIVPHRQFKKSWHHIIIKLVHLRSLNVLSRNTKRKESLNLLELPSCELLEDPMPTLEKLSKLRALVLDYSFSGKTMVCSPQSFPNLHSLSLSSSYNLEDWIVHERALRSLCCLNIYRSPELKSFPEGLKFVTTLHELNIKEMSSSFTAKLLKGGEDFYKIQHVPNVLIEY